MGDIYLEFTSTVCLKLSELIFKDRTFPSWCCIFIFTFPCVCSVVMCLLMKCIFLFYLILLDDTANYWSTLYFSKKHFGTQVFPMKSITQVFWKF